MPRSTALAVLLSSALCACVQPQEHRFVGEDGFYAFAMTDDTPAAVEGEDDALFIVERRIELPIQAPTEAEMGELEAAAQLGTMPFPRLPWVGRDDLPVEIDLALTNLGEDPVQVKVTVDGVNEFHEYFPIAVGPGEEPEEVETTVGFSQWERTVLVGPFETFVWSVHERQMDEVAVDLATVANGAPNPNQVVYFENQSGHDPRVDPYVPEVVPGLVGLRLGMQTGSAARLVMEASVRVRDVAGRLTTEEEAWTLPTPKPLPEAPPLEAPPSE